MRKIKSLQQLKAQNKQLKQRQTELEKAIEYDWRDLKESLKPKNIARQVFSNLFEKKENQNGSAFNTGKLSQMAAKLTKIMAAKAEEKISKWFKK